MGTDQVRSGQMATREGLRSMTQQAQDMGGYDEEEFPYTECDFCGDIDCDESCQDYYCEDCGYEDCRGDCMHEWDDEEPDYGDGDYPDYGPPGSGAVIIEYGGWEYDDGDLGEGGWAEMSEGTY